jgi:tripeptide aminopeptidase
MTTNVGTIRGGSATNIVPDSCALEGEVRGFDPAAIAGHLRLVEEAFSRKASEHGAKVRFQSVVDFAPFVLESDWEVVRRTETVLRRLGLTPDPIEYTGGSDANTLNEMGVPSVNLGIGAQNPHGNDEFILLEDLQMATEIAGELIREAAAS